MKRLCANMIIVAVVAGSLLACQTNVPSDHESSYVDKQMSAEAVFDRTIQEFLSECRREAVETPQEMERRLGLDGLREDPIRRQDMDETDISQLHTVVWHLDMIITEAHFDPYAFMVEKYVEDQQFEFREEAILLLTVFGYESPETDAIRSTWDY